MSSSLRPVLLSELSTARQAHFSRLKESPELFVELMLPQASAYRITWRSRDVGYCLVAEDRCLLEFDLHKGVWSQGAAILREIDAALQLASIRCFSFDSLLLGSCLECGWTPSIEGYCFRDLIDAEGAVIPSGLTWRLARVSDAESIRPHREGVFDDDGQVDEWIARGRVHVLEGADGWVAVGLVSPVWEHGQERDIGILVHPRHRQRGYATIVLRTLVRSCLGRNLRPTAGCGAENVASRRALGRAGFVSQYQLLLFRRSVGTAAVAGVVG